ncbi:glucuronate isomerase [uncultured Gemmiger sp.]|uniref:glucuronate isomerase n=1 Tax=uncultured Gemmiger sp. TaxID=1623490 RepID=UPI0025E187A1|nr:glucuronate isomerase [uncultured Gemmiger sp.]
MKAFMDQNFLLDTPTAQHLYHDYAAKMPICDYHCHIPPQEIYEDRRFDNIAQVWLGGHQVLADGSDYYFGDHYKWRVMRSNGVPEEYITGDKPDRERFQKFAEALEMAIGNPMYTWCHMELKKYFGYNGVLNGETAEEVWNLCNDKLQHDPNMTVRGLIRQSNVAFIGTTDDPIDSLEWHKKIKEDPSITFTVAPSFRPDKAVNIQKPGFAEYMRQFEQVVGREFHCVGCVVKALDERLQYFVSMGCRASDHGLDYVPFREPDADIATAAFQKAMAGEPVTVEEAETYQSYLLCALGRLYHKYNVAMQIHYSCVRNANAKMFKQLGPDTGYDMIAITDGSVSLSRLLSNLTETGECPKVILYSLNPADFDMLGTLIGCFQDDEVPGKIQLGSAWWFCDTDDGMQQQMHTLARLGLLGNFIGMLTDSRSFLSYTRHELFRRIMCNVIGTWVENGQYPNDEKLLKKIVEGISFSNAARYFGL